MFLSFGKYKKREAADKRRRNTKNQQARKSQTMDRISLSPAKNSTPTHKLQGRKRSQSVPQTVDYQKFLFPNAPNIDHNILIVENDQSEYSELVDQANQLSLSERSNVEKSSRSSPARRSGAATVKYAAPIHVSKAAKTEKVITLIVKGPRTVSIVMNNYDTVDLLKQCLMEAFNFENIDFRLWWQKREIKSGKVLAHYNLKDDTVLKISF